VDSKGKFQDIQPAFHQGPGSVIVVPAIDGCQCDYLCVALNARRSRVACICPPEWVLSQQDLKKCIREYRAAQAYQPPEKDNLSRYYAYGWQAWKGV